MSRKKKVRKSNRKRQARTAPPMRLIATPVTFRAERLGLNVFGEFCVVSKKPINPHNVMLNRIADSVAMNLINTVLPGEMERLLAQRESGSNGEFPLTISIYTDMDELRATSFLGASDEMFQKHILYVVSDSNPCDPELEAAWRWSGGDGFSLKDAVESGIVEVGDDGKHYYTDIESPCYFYAVGIFYVNGEECRPPALCLPENAVIETSNVKLIGRETRRSLAKRANRIKRSLGVRASRGVPSLMG